MSEEAKKMIEMFILEMNGWERFCNEVEEEDLDPNEEEKAQKKKLRPIFKKYCTEKEMKRAEGRLRNIAYGEEGSYEYDSEKMPITDCDEKSTGWVITAGDPEEDSYQFTIKKTSSGLLIDSKKRFSSWKKKWVVDTL